MKIVSPKNISAGWRFQRPFLVAGTQGLGYTAKFAWGSKS
jgi:hypothetical protein